MTSVDLSSYDLWFIVDNPNFRDDLCYRALAYLDYGESAKGQLLFMTDEGAPYALPVNFVRCVRGHEKLTRERKEDTPFFRRGEISSWG